MDSLTVMVFLLLRMEPMLPEDFRVVLWFFNLPPLGVSLSRVDHATSFLCSGSFFFWKAIGLMYGNVPEARVSLILD
jgi:hypothetical protein